MMAGTSLGHSKLILLPILVALLIGAPQAHSQETPTVYDPPSSQLVEDSADEDSIDLHSAIEKAIQNNRELALMKTRIEIGRGRLRSSDGVDNPEFRISNISTGYITDEFDELELGLRWRPPRIGEMAEKREEARLRLWERKVEADQFAIELVTRVRYTHADVLLHEELVKIEKQRLEIETKRLALVEKMKDLGRRSIVYYTKARMWLAESRSEYSREVQRRNQARRHLGRLTGIRKPVSVPKNGELPKVELSLEELQEIAYRSRPITKLLEPSLELARAQYNAERFMLIPWFSYLEVSYHMEDRDMDWGELMFGLELPLFNWNIGNIKATKKRINRKRQQSEAVSERIEDQVRIRYNRYQEAILDWELSSKDGKEVISITEELLGDAGQHKTLPADEILELKLTIADTKKLLAEKRHRLAYTLADLLSAVGVNKVEQISGTGNGHANRPE